MDAIDGALLLWFGLTVPAAFFAAYDLAVRTPAMTVMRWGWVLVILYTGPIGLVVYLLSCREPLAGTHADYVAPLWKQSVGSTIHCVAGDATGILLGAVIATELRLPMTLDVVLEYVAGFTFGLLVFQALFMKLMTGGSYWSAVRRTVLPEWLSMNCLMAAMIPVMVILMMRDSSAGEPTRLRFWGVMSLATLVGALFAYPVNVWLVARRLKHGMGTVYVLGRGGHALDAERRAARRESAGRSAPAAHEEREERGASIPRREKVLVAGATVLALAVGVWIAVRFGGL